MEAMIQVIPKILPSDLSFFLKESIEKKIAALAIKSDTIVNPPVNHIYFYHLDYVNCEKSTLFKYI
jgi:hypothetical protein